MVFKINKKNCRKVDYVEEHYQSCGQYNPIIHMYENKEVIAFLKFQEYNIDKVSIEYLKVKESYQNKGYGQKILKYFLELYPKATITLEVRKSNYKAIMFYKKNDFTIIKTIEKYYQKPIEDGYLMQNKH